jgi:PadR family transcriptional regulator PadR
MFHLGKQQEKALRVDYYIGILGTMADGLRLSHNLAMILQTIAAGHRYAYTILAATGLASGTVYPALRRLEEEGLLRAEWEPAADTAGPPRKAFRLTRAGEASLEAARQRYPLLAKLAEVKEP